MVNDRKNAIESPRSCCNRRPFVTYYSDKVEISCECGKTALGKTRELATAIWNTMQIQEEGGSSASVLRLETQVVNLARDLRLKQEELDKRNDELTDCYTRLSSRDRQVEVLQSTLVDREGEMFALRERIEQLKEEKSSTYLPSMSFWEWIDLGEGKPVVFVGSFPVDLSTERIVDRRQDNIIPYVVGASQGDRPDGTIICTECRRDVPKDQINPNSDQRCYPCQEEREARIERERERVEREMELENG